MHALDIAIDPQLGDRAAPEALLQRFAASGVDVERLINELLAGGEPNASHFVAAEILAGGGTVSTTNLDALIEVAARRRSIDYHLIHFKDDPACTCPRGHLFSLHGSVESGPLALSSDQVLTSIGSQWQAALCRAFKGREVAVLGYAGRDLDLRDALDQALAEAKRVDWFAIANDPQGRSRFERLQRSGRLLLHEAGGPAVRHSRPDWLFLDWAKSRSLTRSVPPELLDEMRQPAYPAPLKLGDFRPPPVTQGEVLDAFGDIAGARERFRRALHESGLRARLHAAGRLWGLGLRHGAPWRESALSGLALLTERTPLTYVKKFWRWRLRGLTHIYRPSTTLPVAEKALERFQDDDDFQLQLANAAKLVGQLDRARQLALSARDKSRSSGKTERAATASLNLSITLRWLGDLASAQREADHLASDLGPLAGLNHQSWGVSEQGCVAALRGREAEGLLRRAIEDFALLTDDTSLIDAQTFLIPVLRLAGERKEAEELLTATQRQLEAVQTPSRFREEALLIEVAELARIDRRYPRAGQIFSKLAESNHLIHAILALLGLGECQREERERPEAAERALERSRAAGVRFGALHALVTLGRDEPRRTSECEAEIARLGYPAPERTDGTTGLLRFCLGPDPERHQIAFP